MNKRYIKERPNGGIEITIFTGEPPLDHSFIEVDQNDLIGKNPDKCRIDKNGKVYEDKDVFTKEDRLEALKESAKSKLKSVGLTDDEIEAIIK